MKRTFIFSIFIFVWLIINLVTATSVELYDDEAYYWMYSQFLDWGYFDHPPGVAIIIKLGAFLGKSEIGVRLVNILLTAFSISVIYSLIKPQNVIVFCLSVFSFLVLHIIGFVTLPDGPFFLTAILFLIAYRKFLASDSLINSFLLGLSAAAMIYCKYHGILVIFFTFCSNIALLKNYKTYLIAAVTLALISPHIYWQYVNGFPSISYHLADRAAPEYRIAQTFDYLFGNLPFLGGMVAVVLFIAAIGYSPIDKWEKALKWNLFGIFGFFFLITFKGQYIEANWTLFCVFPMLYLGYKRIEVSRHFVAYKYLTIIFASVLVLFRIHLVAPFMIIEKDRIWDFYGGKSFAKEVKKVAGNRKIIANRYQDAAILNFYLNEPYFIPAININSRASQFSIWKFEQLLCNQDIAFVNSNIQAIAIKARKFDSTSVSLLNEVLLPNCMALYMVSSKIQNDSLVIKLNIEFQKPLTTQKTSDLQIKTISLFKNKKIKEAFFDITNDGFQEIKISINKSTPIDNLAIRFYSEKLGGAFGKPISVHF